MQSAESFFAILKRGVYGTFHSISEQHLQRYCDEFAFRWNNRSALGIEDFERAAEILKGIAGKRVVSRCLTQVELRQFYLPDEPSRWCITVVGLDPGNWQPFVALPHGRVGRLARRPRSRREPGLADDEPVILKAHADGAIPAAFGRIWHGPTGRLRSTDRSKPGGNLTRPISVPRFAGFECACSVA